MVSPLFSYITQFADQVRIRLISQLIKGISRVLEKLFKYFSGTVIFVFIIPWPLVLFRNFNLDLNDSASVILLFGSSLINFQMFFDNYHYILLHYTYA